MEGEPLSVSFDLDRSRHSHRDPVHKFSPAATSINVPQTATRNDASPKNPPVVLTIGAQAAEDAATTREPNKLTDEELARIRELKNRDREVRAHEQAHLSALGPYRQGGPSFTYETGPDGKQYAVAGEVPVDVSPEKTPEETIDKAQTVRRAALAPAKPSSADRSVAAKASQLENQARTELAQEKVEEEKDDSPKQSGEVGEVEAQAATEESKPSVEKELAKKLEAFERHEPQPCPLCGGNASDGHTHVGFSA